MLQAENHLNSDSTPDEKSGETISELAGRHLRDENHVTTDEEIRNAVVEVDGTVDLPEEMVQHAKETNETVIPAIPGEPKPTVNSDTSTNNDVDSPLPNPYDVLR